MKNRKLRLLGSLVLPLFAVATASVSTYAWFRAEGAVHIQATNVSCDITVSAPDTIDAGAPLTYAYKGNGTIGHYGAVPSTATIDDDFAEITSENYSSLANVTSIIPGRRMTFVLAITEEHGVNISTASLALEKYGYTNSTTRHLLNAGKTAVDGTNHICVEEAINIYAKITKSSTFGDSTYLNDDLFEFTSTNLPAGSDTDASVGQGYQKVRTLTENLPLCSDDEVLSTSIYIYYTIEFSEDRSTFYQEYVHADDKYVEAEEIPSSTTINRYFSKKQSGGVYQGSSSCYEGLKFAIAGLKILLT